MAEPPLEYWKPRDTDPDAVPPLLLALGRISILATLATSGVWLFLLPGGAFLVPPFLFATAGWLVLAAGLRPFWNERLWGYRLELVGARYSGAAMGYVLAQFTRVPRGWPIVEFGILGYLIVLPDPATCRCGRSARGHQLDGSEGQEGTNNGGQGAERDWR